MYIRIPSCVENPSGSRNVMTKGVLMKPGSSPQFMRRWNQYRNNGPIFSGLTLQ